MTLKIFMTILFNSKENFTNNTLKKIYLLFLPNYHEIYSKENLNLFSKEIKEKEENEKINIKKIDTGNKKNNIDKILQIIDFGFDKKFEVFEQQINLLSKKLINQTESINLKNEEEEETILNQEAFLPITSFRNYLKPNYIDFKKLYRNDIGNNEFDLLIFYKTNFEYVVRNYFPHFLLSSDDFLIKKNLQKVRENFYNNYKIKLLLIEEENVINDLIDNLIENCFVLIIDQFGNYVIQSILLLNNAKASGAIALKICDNLQYYSKHRYSSNVIEKCFDYCGKKEKKVLVQKICSPEMIADLILDEHGNYVVQKALFYADQKEKEFILQNIVMLLTKIKLTPFGEKLLNRLIINYPILNNYIYNNFNMPELFQNLSLDNNNMNMNMNNNYHQKNKKKKTKNKKNNRKNINNNNNNENNANENIFFNNSNQFINNSNNNFLNNNINVNNNITINNYNNINNNQMNLNQNQNNNPENPSLNYINFNENMINNNFNQNINYMQGNMNNNENDKKKTKKKRKNKNKKYNNELNNQYEGNEKEEVNNSQKDN